MELIGAATYYIGCNATEAGFSWSGLATATFIGAASAAVTFGIGSASSAMFSNFYSQAAFQAVAHSAFQGGMTAINGGNFWNGFAAGALSSIASSAWSGGSTTTTYKVGSFSDTITNTHGGLAGLTGLNNSVGTVLFGTIAGAGGAALTGGNVWLGAATGLTVSLLNHTAHQNDPPGKRVKNLKWKNNTDKFIKKINDFLKEYVYLEGTAVVKVGAYADIGIKHELRGTLGTYQEFGHSFNNRDGLQNVNNKKFVAGAADGYGGQYTYDVKSGGHSVSGGVGIFSADYDFATKSTFIGININFSVGIGFGVEGGGKFGFKF